MAQGPARDAQGSQDGPLHSVSEADLPPGRRGKPGTHWRRTETTHPCPAWWPASRAKFHFSLVLQPLHSHRPPTGCPGPSWADDADGSLGLSPAGATLGLSLAGQAPAGAREQGRDNYTANNHRAPVGRRCRSGGLHSEPPHHLPGHWGAGWSQGFTASHLLLRMNTETEVPFWAPPVVFAEAEGSMRNV